MIIFGPGVITITPSNVVNPTPVNVGLAQEISYDETGSMKSLYGQNRRALAIGAGTIKATGKIKAARFSSSAMAALLLGVTPTAGQTTTAIAEAHTPASSTFTISNTTGFVDQGVVYASSLAPLTRVASAPAVGQYTVTSGGVYTFNASDTVGMLATYTYTVAGSGYSVPIGNPMLGPVISFGINIATVDPTNNKTATWQIFNAVISKFSIGTKLEDFAMPEYDFECYASASGAFGQWNYADNM